MTYATSRHAAFRIRRLIAAALLIGLLGACGGTAPAGATPVPTPSATATPSAPRPPAPRRPA